jgi:hypothetical protein
MMLCGAAATIGADDLAAIAKGRHAGVGQVLVQFEPSTADIWECPIGAAAYVDFPDIGILDVLRARLRLSQLIRRIAALKQSMANEIAHADISILTTGAAIA